MKYAVKGVQIPANEALSGVVDLEGYNLVAIEMPETFAGTAITFAAKAESHGPTSQGQEAEDWDNVYDDAGTEVSLTVAGDRVVVIGTVTKAAVGALRFIRLRSGTSGTPVAQNPAKEFRLILKGA